MNKTYHDYLTDRPVGEPTAPRTDWMETFTGRKFYALEPRVEDICIEDIAHALSMICRFGGHCREFYSVAQHSCYVCNTVAAHEPELALSALMHDAAEAYVGDVIRPIKRSDPRFGHAEAAVARCVEVRFGVSLVDPVPEIVAWADNVVLKSEHAQLMDGRNEWLSCDQAEGPHVEIEPWSPARAEEVFLKTFKGWCEK